MVSDTLSKISGSGTPDITWKKTVKKIIANVVVTNRFLFGECKDRTRAKATPPLSPTRFNKSFFI